MHDTTLKLLIHGDSYSIYGLIHNNRCEADEFLLSLSDREKKKLIPLLHYTAQSGIITNEQKFKSIGNGIFEFKGFQARLFCFFDKGRIVILTNGCIKKRNRLDPAAIAKAGDRKVIYLGKGKRK